MNLINQDQHEKESWVSEASDIATTTAADQLVANGADRVARMLLVVGERVRLARGRSGWSRRELAERSGVSQRTIAQLETGQGNITLGLLLRLAEALSLDVADMVAHRDPLPDDVLRLAGMIAAASPDQRQRAEAVLTSAKAAHSKASRVAFVGLRGAGKSTIGARVAQLTDRPFLELNDQIAAAGGMAVDEIIALYGQEGYRHLERRAIEQVADRHDDIVVAVAGGIVSQAETFDYLLGHFFTVWLKATPEEHMARVRAQGDDRPMAGNPDAMAVLRRILRAREENYGRADLCVDTSGRSVDVTVQRVLAQLDGI